MGCFGFDVWAFVGEMRARDVDVVRFEGALGSSPISEFGQMDARELGRATIVRMSSCKIRHWLASRKCHTSQIRTERISRYKNRRHSTPIGQ